MIKVVFTMFDVKAGLYFNPMFFRAKPEALRSFSEITNDLTHQVGKYPDDFVFYELGTFDDVSGVFSLLEAPRQIAVAREFVQSV